jgi:glycosyltransferase involved in cell wall biosynthesis
MKNKNVLFIIPAYNESENIRKVLQDIKKNASFADI